jgi:hypothetical protein
MKMTSPRLRLARVAPHDLQPGRAAARGGLPRRPTRSGNQPISSIAVVHQRRRRSAQEEDGGGALLFVLYGESLLK